MALSGEARERISAELAQLRQDRDRMLTGLQSDQETVGDHVDAADELQLAGDVAAIDDRITELQRLLLAGPPEFDPGSTLPDGTEVTLRFSDGRVATMRVTSVVEEVPVDQREDALTADSPLGLALAGHQPGDTITYSTPEGRQQVELLAVSFPE